MGTGYIPSHMPRPNEPVLFTAAPEGLSSDREDFADGSLYGDHFQLAGYYGFDRWLGDDLDGDFAVNRTAVFFYLWDRFRSRLIRRYSITV